MKSSDFTIARLGDATLPSPLRNTEFTPDNAAVTYETNLDRIVEYQRRGEELPAFEMAGPREKIYHDPAWSRAAILTAGGLCPGLNDVIKFLTLTLRSVYHVPIVHGIRYGFRGLAPGSHLAPIELNEDNTDDIHMQGGSILGSARGEEDTAQMIDTLSRMNINLLFCIGGDGTLRCAHELALEAAKRELPISIVDIPKTIDNDIGFIDKSFGFETAVYTAGTFASCAHSEAKGAYNGIGLIKVMGRDSGFIAAYASLANSYINYCLVPECKFVLDGDGPNAFLPHLFRRMQAKSHAVIMVAEGAGQELFPEGGEQYDASGNLLKKDIGVLLKSEIKRYFDERNTEVNIKYFDTSYTVRSVPAHGSDAVFCAMLAQNAVHAAMSGRTDVVVGHWAGQFTHVPIALATRQRKKIELTSPLWTCVKASTSFTPDPVAENQEEGKEK